MSQYTARDLDQEFELKKRINEVFENAYNASRKSFPDRLEAGVLAVCRTFHLVYYEGRGGDLHKASGAPI